MNEQASEHTLWMNEARQVGRNACKVNLIFQCVHDFFLAVLTVRFFVPQITRPIIFRTPFASFSAQRHPRRLNKVQASFFHDS